PAEHSRRAARRGTLPSRVTRRRRPRPRRRPRLRCSERNRTRKQRESSSRAGRGANSAGAAHSYAGSAVAEDTEKLIRQLSLISFLMVDRRPVTALEIKQGGEGHWGMNDVAFAR